MFGFKKSGEILRLLRCEVLSVKESHATSGALDVPPLQRRRENSTTFFPIPDACFLLSTPRPWLHHLSIRFDSPQIVGNGKSVRVDCLYPLHGHEGAPARELAGDLRHALAAAVCPRDVLHWSISLSGTNQHDEGRPSRWMGKMWGGDGADGFSAESVGQRRNKVRPTRERTGMELRVLVYGCEH